MTKVLKKTPVYETDLFTIYKDNVELNSGEKKIYHSGLRKPSVTVLPLDDQRNVYLIDQYRYLHEQRLIEAVAGLIEEGEETLTAAKRELKEELGIKANKWTKLGTFQSAGSIISWDYTIFLAQDLEFGEQELEDSEDINSVKMSLDEAVKGIFDGTIHSSSTINAILMASKLHTENEKNAAIFDKIDK